MRIIDSTVSTTSTKEWEREELLRLAHEAGVWVAGQEPYQSQLEKFAELIIKECTDNLAFHGFDDAIPYLEWWATNRLGIKYHMKEIRQEENKCTVWTRVVYSTE